MKYLKLEEIPIGISNFYDANLYPKTGVYLDRLNIYFVDKQENIVNSIFNPGLDKYLEESSGAISESLLLKALAVIQKPELIKEI